MTMVMLRNEIVCECRLDSRPLRHVGTLGVARYRYEGCARATVMTMVMLRNEIVCECRIDSRPLRHVGTLGVARCRN